MMKFLHLSVFVILFSQSSADTKGDTGTHYCSPNKIRRPCNHFKGYNTIEQYRELYPNSEISDEQLKDTSGTKIPLTDAQNTIGAACLDGSVPVVYWRPGAAKNKFHVYFEGGGWYALKFHIFH